MKNYTKTEMNDMTVVALRELCKTYGITGMSKARKDIIILAISEYYKIVETPATTTTTSTSPVVANDNGKLPYLNANIHSFIEDDNSYKSLISVSCGAASSNYPVVGKSVGYVKSTFREILNIETESNSVVNGSEVAESYVLKSGDTLEFVRKAGTKGIK